jgi:hypothetical protein
MGGDVAGVGNATSGSITDNLTREHRMTLDEAQLILHVKRDDGLEAVLKVRHIISASYGTSLLSVDLPELRTPLQSQFTFRTKD